MPGSREDAQKDPWSLVKAVIDAFNECRETNLVPGSENVINESMANGCKPFAVCGVSLGGTVEMCMLSLCTRFDECSNCFTGHLAYTYHIAGNFRGDKFSWFLRILVVRGLNFVVSVNLEIF